MKFGIGIIPQEKHLNKSIDLIKHAENLGFDYAWISDKANIDLFKLLRNIAFETEHITVGSGVTNPYIRDENALISEFTNLCEMFDNRIVMGIGPGNKDTVTKRGYNWEKPANTIKKVINKTKGKIPTYVEVQSQRLLKIAHKNANGVLIPSSHPKDFDFLLHNTQKDSFDIASYCATSIDRNPLTAKNTSKIVVAFILAGSSPAVLERHEISHELRNKIYMNLLKGNIGDAVRLIDDDLINIFSVTGTPNQVINKINLLNDAGVNQFIFSPPYGKNITEAMNLFDEVIESF